MPLEPIDQVVLIDDNAIDLFVQRRFIERSMFANAIVEFQSPNEALKHFSSVGEEIPDLIFLDLNMPEMDGFTFLEQLARLPGKIKKSVPVVILTSSSSEKDHERASLFENVIGFLSKPLTSKSLADLRVQLVDRP